MARLPRIRRSLIAAVAAAFLAYLVLGHAHHPGKTMDDAAMGAGICIVLVTLAAAAALAQPRPSVFATPLLLALPTAAPVTPLKAMPARASPQWLQRFLN